MKKMTAYILILVLVASMLPMGSSAAKLGDKPFYFVNVSGGFGDLPNCYSMPMFYTYPMTADSKEPRVSYAGTDNVAEIAQKLKEDFNSRPVGTRYFQYCAMYTVLHAKAETVVYYDVAKEMVKKWLETFLKEYSRIGGELDGVVIDLEYIESHAYYLRDYYKGTRNKTKNERIYHEIVSDSRYKTQIRDALEDAGFKFFEDPKGEKPEIWCTYSSEGQPGHENCYSIWNALMDNRECAAITEAVYDPLVKYYPNASVCDYQSGDFKGWVKSVDNFGAIRSWNLNKAGNTSNYNSYSTRPVKAFYGTDSAPNYAIPPSYNKAYYAPSSFQNAQFDVNLIKDMYTSTDNGNISLWVADYLYNIESKEWDVELEGSVTTYSNTPYYSELVYHYSLMDPKPLLGFAVQSRIFKHGGEYETCIKVLSELMVELTRVAGASDRKPIWTKSNWSGGYVMSGMYAAGRNIWRLTPDTTLVSLKDFKVAGDAPTFSVDGLTIKFPGGKIIEDGKISEVGSCGYWIETPADVYPVITGTADRYRENPAYLENFEGYQVGAEFTSKTALLKGTWDAVGSAAIRANGNNKVLQLTGSTTVANMKLPKNVTAGDEYAKQQVWEITFTLPEGNYGALTLLSCCDKDGGLKVEKGKVYYDEKGSFKELEGVTLGAGTYTLLRTVDFRKEKAYTNSYTLYNAAGNVVGEVKDVPMVTDLSLPVQYIACKTIGAANPVFLDNYKLYAAGANMVFELYETKYGRELSDVTAKRTEDTAYRMSWLNATDSDKYYSVVAAYYDGDTLVSEKVVKSLTVTPGTDGVETGVVGKGSAGQTLLVYLREDGAPVIPPAGDGGTTDGSVNNNGSVNEPSGNGNANTPNGEGSQTPNAPQDDLGGGKKGIGVVIIVIAVIVVAAGACGAVLWLKKKKAN